jgi:hypothetical protein
MIVISFNHYYFSNMGHFKIHIKKQYIQKDYGIKNIYKKIENFDNKKAKLPDMKYFYKKQ